MKTGIAFAVLTGLGAVTAPAQNLDLTKRYNIVARKDTGKLQKDLNRAGQNGFRVVTGSTTGGDEVTLLIEKAKDGGVYEYMVVSAGKTQKLEQKIGLASSQGYRLLPNTIRIH